MSTSSANGDGRVSLADELPGPGWRDAALVLADGTVREHVIRHPDVADMVRRVVPSPPDAEDGCVFASELAFYASGRFNRVCSVFSIYWQNNSQLIYILTGITHCTKIIIECGQVGSNGQDKFYDQPGMYLIRPSDGTVMPRNVVWPGTSARWSDEVQIRSAQRQLTVARSFINYFRDSMFWMEQRPNDDLCPCPVEVEDRLFPLLNMSRGDVQVFDKRVGAAYKRLSTNELPRCGRRLLDHCVNLAASKKLLLLDLPRLENFFLTQVCLYELDEDEVGEELLGMLCGKVSDGDAKFLLHRKTMKVAACVAFILNCLHKHQDRLPEVNQRVDECDLLIIALRRYYRHHAGVQSRAVSAAQKFLQHYGDSFSPFASLTRLGVHIPLDANVTRKQLVSILRA
ncbi:tegument protein UL88 [Mandrillus leucophaeus cytomegalovirus]|uniref:Tegument protein UL88 n=1 Tax=Mandrillus leucophaeus cytomegalovirus TaxID=1654930 RepID=A0A0G2UI32_9BETA|nr:tegument protein UL88 [Mandrillus leucophaeus cytomegalovirus]AKI29759.1 tegument protein UL88 [Mandrillus leucophaeus cytomegalovirus]